MVYNQASTASEQLLVSLSKVLQTLREQNNIEVLIDSSLKYLQTQFNYQLIWISLYDRLDHQLCGQGGITPNEETRILKQRFALSSGDLLEQVIIQLQPLKIPDLRSELRAKQWRNIAHNFNIQGTILFPLQYQDRCLGVVLLGSQQWGVTPSRTEEELLSILFGELAASLHRLETEWYLQNAKQSDQSLFNLLSGLHQTETLEQFLEAVVEQIHQFIEPSRTCIYWYSKEGRYFWRRISNTQKTPDTSRNRAASGITAQEFKGFYQALNAEKVVVIGEAYSSLKRGITQRLMQKMRVRSLLAAPIRLHQELQGFVAVEVHQSRLWQKAEKTFLQGIAQLIEAVAPKLEIEAQLEQAQQDSTLITALNWTIAHEEDWRLLLKTTANQLCQRLGIFRFLLLQWNPLQQQFEIIYQTPSLSRRLIRGLLPPLPKIDQQTLQQQQILALENWEITHLKPWQEWFRPAGVRSLLMAEINLSNTEPSHSPGALLVVAHDAPRTWAQSEKLLVKQIAQHLGFSLQQWQLIQRLQDQNQVIATLHSSWQILQPTDPVEELERHWLNQMAIHLNRPWVGLISWSETEAVGHLVVSELPNTHCPLERSLTFDISTEPLIKKALNTEELLHLKVNHLPVATQQWLKCPGIELITVIALRTYPDYPPTGVLILPEPETLSLNSEDYTYQFMFIQLATQFAWLRRCQRVQHHLYHQREELKWLNWYKQRRLEEFYRIVGQGFKQLNELAQSPLKNGKTHSLHPEIQSTLTEKEPEKQSFQQLTLLRYQQLFREIGNALAAATALIKHEQWQLQNNHDPIPVANLLRRVSHRIKPLLKQYKVQLHIHRSKHYDILGDRIKLELIFYELLLMSCQRCDPETSIEIYVQAMNERQIKIEILDSGWVNPQLMIDLTSIAVSDLLTPSTLDTHPGQHLLICKQVIEQMGGEFHLEQYSNSRVLTQLILPRVSTGGLPET